MGMQRKWMGCRESCLLLCILFVGIFSQQILSAELSLDDLVVAANKIRPHIAAQKPKTAKKVHKGIVIAAGGSDQLANALATVQVLRYNLSCQLHVEVIYYGNDEADVDFISKLEDLPAVKAVDASLSHIPHFHYVPESKIGYFKKAAAIYACSFDQLLYLDADNTPLQDPSDWFEWPEFQKHGNQFWPDYMGTGRHESVKDGIYDAFEIESPWASDPGWKCSESGQFLLDRRQHADVMEWILFVNAHHEISYKYIYGDKDTFEFAFNLAGKGAAYQRVPYGPRASFRQLPEEENYAHTGMLQTNSKGEPLFFHQVAGGKFHLTDKVLALPEFASLGMTINGLDHMHWGGDIGTLRVYKSDAIQYKDLKCSDLDTQTATLLAQSEKRWKSCSKEATSDGVPIPLLPLALLPNYTLNTITALAHHFQVAQLDFKEMGGPEM